MALKQTSQDYTPQLPSCYFPAWDPDLSFLSVYGGGTPPRGAVVRP